ncbi:MAG: DNA polymerase III subunit delta [Bacteroidetes bacterium]|nr:DNA polymerase III subunit delta [Bacteroidota bacterium]
MALAKSRKEKFPSYDAFLDVLKTKKLSPVYLFIGEEDFLAEECVDNVIQQLLTADTKAFNLDVVYGSKADARDVIAHAASFPMMSSHRIVIIKEFEKLLTSETAKEIVASYISRPLDSTCMILMSEKPDFRTKPFSDLKKTGQVFAFTPLYDNQIPSWISERCRKIGREIDMDACRLLQAYVGNSLRAIHNELDKLFIYIGERKRVTTEDIADVVGAARGFTVFDLQNAVGKKNIEQALKIVDRMLEAGESSQLMIVMLTRYFNILWKLQSLFEQHVSDTDAIASIRVSPYYFKDYDAAARLFTKDQIEHSFSALLEADVKLKSTSPNPYHLMEMLVYSLIREHEIKEKVCL